jgi:Lipase (class 3)
MSVAASTQTLAKSVTSTSHSTTQNHFSKVWLYSNSRLLPYLPPCKFYIGTYPLLCLAAQYSLRVYDKPSKRAEKENHIAASVLHGTKAMTLKSLPLDDMNTVVFAIRGSQSFVDWAVNFRPAPTSPKGFLDDPGNLCHAGFLCVAKAMIKPVADRLRTLLQEDPSRSTASLLITGHSAGGAVAQLLYAHMMAEVVSSELTYLTGFFKRVHCVTFGAPPVSLLPLKRPGGKRHHKSMFFAFANEGDPVVRADKGVLKSLLKLLATPAPSSDKPDPVLSTVVPALKQGKKAAKRPTAPPKASSYPTQFPSSTPAPAWKIPLSILSCGGRIILLRERLGARDADDIEACQVTDEELRKVVFGDPMCHTMVLYARRIETLATRAVTAGGIAA